MEQIIYMPKIKFGTRSFYVNGIDEKVWYDNFYSEDCSRKIKIKCGSLLSMAVDKIGGSGKSNCKFNEKNWSFELENDNYFAFSANAYFVVYDKINQTYQKYYKNPYIRNANYDFSSIVKDRIKKGLKVK